MKFKLEDGMFEPNVIDLIDFNWYTNFHAIYWNLNCIWQFQFGFLKRTHIICNVKIIKVINLKDTFAKHNGSKTNSLTNFKNRFGIDLSVYIIDASIFSSNQSIMFWFSNNLIDFKLRMEIILIEKPNRLCAKTFWKF